MELSISITFLLLLFTGVFEVVAGLEAYRILAAATYEGGRLAAIDSKLAIGKWRNLNSGSSCTRQGAQNPCTGHLSFQDRMRWLINLYSDNNNYSGFSTITEVTSGLEVEADLSGYPQNVQNLESDIGDIVVANVKAPFNGFFGKLSVNLNVDMWAPYLYQKRETSGSSKYMEALIGDMLGGKSLD